VVLTAQPFRQYILHIGGVQPVPYGGVEDVLVGETGLDDLVIGVVLTAEVVL